MESAGDFEPASDGGRLDSRLFGIQGSGALLMGPREEECRHGGTPSQRGLLAWSGGWPRGRLRARGTLSMLARNQGVRLHG